MGIMNFAEVMDKAVSVFRKYAKTYIAFIFVFGIITIGCITGFGIVSVIGFTVAAFASPSPTTGVIMVAVIYLGGITFVLISHIGHIKIASQAYSKERVFLGNAIGACFKNMYKVFLILLAAVIMFVPAGFLFYYVFKALIKAAQFSMISFGYYEFKEIMLIIFFVLAIIAVLLVAIAYFTVFSYAFPAAVVEKKGPIGAIKRSFTLIRGNFWRTFGAMLLILITIYALQGSLQSFITLFNYLLERLFVFLNIDATAIVLLSVAMGFIVFPLQIIYGQIITSLAINMVTFLYYNTRFKKEGYDIVLKLKEIQKIQERKQASEFVSNNNTI